MTRLQLFYPTKPYFIGQSFGENRGCIEDKPGVPYGQRKVIGKADGAVCPAGYVDLYASLGMKGHNGYDCYAQRWQPVYAAVDGTVVEVETEPERGLGVGVLTDEKFSMDEFGEHFFKKRDWHFIALEVKLNQKVKAGDLLGYADSTGISGGDHNHDEGKPVEKRPDGTYYNVFQDNGYYGAIPHAKFYTGYAAQDIHKVINILRSLVFTYERVLDFLKSRT